MARARADGLPATPPLGREVESDDEVTPMPVFVPPPPHGTMPTPPAGVRYYTTPSDYAEAERKRTESAVRREVEARVGPLEKQLDTLSENFEEHRRWTLTTETARANQIGAVHHETVLLRNAVDGVSIKIGGIVAEQAKRTEAEQAHVAAVRKTRADRAWELTRIAIAVIVTAALTKYIVPLL